MSGFQCQRCVTPSKCGIYGCCPGTWPAEVEKQQSVCSATPQTPTDRQRAYKARHRAAGRKELRNLWAHPDDHDAIKAFTQACNLARKLDRVTA